LELVGELLVAEALVMEATRLSAALFMVTAALHFPEAL
jgi:hypothetical protein